MPSARRFSIMRSMHAFAQPYEVCPRLPLTAEIDENAMNHLRSCESHSSRVASSKYLVANLFAFSTWKARCQKK